MAAIWEARHTLPLILWIILMPHKLRLVSIFHHQLLELSVQLNQQWVPL
uniref:Uncharacterized protein n=1 Tax=Arundo donax TaxID=35708 RepID=A0A0A9G9Q0_ARUDO